MGQESVEGNLLELELAEGSLQELVLELAMGIHLEVCKKLLVLRYLE